MFGNRFFGNRYFGDRYWGQGGAAPVTSSAHSGVYRRVLIELYEREWAGAQAKKTQERLEEIGLRQEARVHRVKRVRIEPTIVAERLEGTAPSQVSAELRAAPKKPSLTPVRDLLATVMDNLAAPVPLVDYQRELRTSRRKREEEQIVFFLVSQLEEEES